jgi:hypothetical protein
MRNCKQELFVSSKVKHQKTKSEAPNSQAGDPKPNMWQMKNKHAINERASHNR